MSQPEQSAPVDRLIGREPQLSQLRRALSSTAAGSGTCVVLEGPPGIGKSRLLTAAREIAGDAGLTTAIGHATEIDRSAPLSTLLSALANNPALAPGVAAVAGGGGPVWLVDRIGEFLESYVSTRPLVIALDDAHWADELTTFALRVLVPALSQAPLMWLLARRPGPARRSAQETIDRLVTDGAQCIEVGPLDDAEVGQLCTALLGMPPDPALLAEVSRSGGNPFLVEELVCSLRGAGQLSFDDGVARLLASQLPATFLEAVQRRLRHLSGEARRLLDAGSVLGRPFTVHEAAGLVGVSAIDLIPAAKEAVDVGALVDRDGELAFRHDLFRSAVYDVLPGPVRRALHREAAAVVEREGRSPIEVAEHLVRSGHVRDQQAVTVVIDAVEQVAPTSPATAADLLLRVVDLLDETDPCRTVVVAKAVRLLASAGRVVEARNLGERAIHPGLDPADAATLLLGLAEASKHAGDNHAVVDYTRTALAWPDVPEGLRAQLLATQAHALLRTEEFDRADDVAAEAVRLGTATDNREAVVFATAARGCVALSTGSLDEALSYARDAVTMADANGGETLHRHPRLWLARALVATDRFAEADAVLELGQREATRLGTAWSQPLWHYYRAELRMAAGRLEDALAEGEAGVRVAEQSNALAVDVPMLALLGHIFLQRNEMAKARNYLVRAQQLLREGISVGPEDLAWRVALLEDAEGDREAAFRSLADIYALLPDRVQLLVDEPDAGTRLVRIAMQVGEYAYAERAADAARRLADRNPRVASLRAGARHAEGVLRADAEALHEAIEDYRISPRPLLRAAALEDAACIEDSRGNRTLAVELLEEAATHYETHSALRDAARVAQELQAMGTRRKPRRPAEASSSFGRLTESELRVVRLVAEGLTNRQVAARLFLSPHTVDSHLRHSFAKLGVNSRVELTRHVVEHRID